MIFFYVSKGKVFVLGNKRGSWIFPIFSLLFLVRAHYCYYCNHNKTTFLFDKEFTKESASCFDGKGSSKSRESNQVVSTNITLPNTYTNTTKSFFPKNSISLPSSWEANYHFIIKWGVVAFLFPLYTNQIFRLINVI